MSWRQSTFAWLTALAISAVLVVNSELNRHHFAAHRLGPRIAAGVVAWLGIAVIIRVIVFVVARAAARIWPRT
jgi:branched-subunit amino acid transport protein